MEITAMTTTRKALERRDENRLKNMLIEKTNNHININPSRTVYSTSLKFGRSTEAAHNSADASSARHQLSTGT